MKVQKSILIHILTAVFAIFVLMAAVMLDLSYGTLAGNDIDSIELQSLAGQDILKIDFDRGFDISIVTEYIEDYIQTQPNIPPVQSVIIPPIVEESWEKTARVEDVEGIGPVYARILREKAGITTVGQLLEAGATRQGRKKLKEITGIGHKLILEWVNLADLMRIKGVNSEYSDLLEEAGVDTVKELGKRVPENLYQKMKEVNEKKHLVRRLPSLSQVEDWVMQARTLQPKVTY